MLPKLVFPTCVLYLKEAILTPNCVGGQLRPGIVLHQVLKEDSHTICKSMESGVDGARRSEIAGYTYWTLSNVHGFDLRHDN